MWEFVLLTDILFSESSLFPYIGFLTSTLASVHKRIREPGQARSIIS